MKKILLLGGSRYILPIIDAVHKLGYYAITCDYLPDNIAHKFSDEYHNVSIVDKEAVLALAQELKVDGVLSFACDPGVETAAYVSEKMGLPTNPDASVAILQNKADFRKFLTDNGFNVPKAKGYATAEEAYKELDSFHWPIIVKPVDSAGSKGVTKVEQKADFMAAAQHAIEYSIDKKFIVEEFIQQVGYSSDSDCFSIDGNLVFVSFSNQMFDANAENPYTPSGYSWPSTMPQEVQAELRSELQRLVTLLGLKTSIYNVETRLGTDGKPYIMEMSPRGGGNRLSEMLRYACGADLVTNSIRACVGDSIEGIEHDPQYDGHYAEMILHADADGTLDSIEISKELEPFVVEKDFWVHTGDTVHKFTGANETIGTLVLKFSSQEELEKYTKNIANYVQIQLQ